MGTAYCRCIDSKLDFWLLFFVKLHCVVIYVKSIYIWQTQWRSGRVLTISWHTGMFTKNWHICFTIFTEPNVARMTLRIPNDSAIDGILFNRHLNYFIPTSQSQQGVFDMAYFSGQRATEEGHLHLNRRISTHSCRCRTAAVPEYRRSLCTIT